MEEKDYKIMEGYKQYPIKRHFYTEKERQEDPPLDYIKYMIKTYGEYGSKVTMEKAIKFLGEPPKEEDLPEWLQGLGEKEEPLFEPEKETEVTDIQLWEPQDIVLNESLIHSGIITDRLLDLAEFEKPLSHWAIAVHHVFCHKLFHDYIKDHPLMKKKFFSIDDFVDMIRSFPKDIQIYLPKPSFTDSEFRKITGTKLTRSQILKAVKEYEDLKIKVIHASVYNKEEKKDVEIETRRELYTREPVGKILYDTTNTTFIYKDRKSKKIKNAKENKYYLSLNLLGFIIWCRFFNQNFEIKNPKVYQLPGYSGGRAQKIYHKIYSFQSVKRDIVVLSEYAGYLTENFHIPKRRKDIERLLKILKENGLIYSWFRMKDKSGYDLQGLKTTWFIRIKPPKYVKKG